MWLYFLFMALNSKASALLGAIVLNTMFGQVTTVSHTAWSKTFTKCLKCPGATNTCGWDNLITSHFRNSFNGNIIDAYILTVGSSYGNLLLVIDNLWVWQLFGTTPQHKSETIQKHAMSNSIWILVSEI